MLALVTVRASVAASALWACGRPFEEARVYEDALAIHAALRTVAESGGWRSAGCRYIGVVALGGSMGAYEDEAYPWMADEKQLLRDAIAAGG